MGAYMREGSWNISCYESSIIFLERSYGISALIDSTSMRFKVRARQASMLVDEDTKAQTL